MGVNSSTTVSIKYSRFIIPKKEGTLMFITDYLRLNHQLVRKPHPLTIIGKIMKQLQGFQHTTKLNINMGHYTIRILSDIHEMTMIVT